MRTYEVFNCIGARIGQVSANTDAEAMAAAKAVYRRVGMQVRRVLTRAEQAQREYDEERAHWQWVNGE